MYNRTHNITTRTIHLFQLKMDVNSDDEDCLDDFLDTAINNGQALSSILSKYSDTGSFLLREDEYLSIRAVSMTTTEQEELLEIVTDIDGVVIEWNTFSAILHPVRHLYILPKDILSLKCIWPLLKKHLDLRKYSDAWLKTMHICLGSQLFYEFGWEYWLGLIPETNTAEIDADAVRLYTFTTLRSIRKEFQKRLQDASKSNKILNTLVKNNLNDVRKLTVLPDDSTEILTILQEAIENVNNPPCLRKILFSFRFGEKCRKPVKLPVSDSSAVADISVHAAITLIADEDINIFWARHGLQEIVGERGNLTTCMSFSECANFQTNLDGRDIDIKSTLRRVCKSPERLRFVQLYADLPHRYPKTRQHPVSGSIIISKSVHHETLKSFQNDAEIYLAELENNFSLLNKSKCRIEMVLSVPTGSLVLDANSLFSFHHLTLLIQDHNLFVPFWCKKCIFINFLRKTGLYMVSTLKDLYMKFKLTGNCGGVWSSYQLELALEKLLWGHPLCFMSQQYSINLGPGIATPSRSKTDQLGFLALENEFSSIENEEETPPLKMYSKSEIIQRQIKKLYSFDDYIESSSTVLGRRSVYILLQDLYDIGHPNGNFTDFYLSLKCSSVISPTLVTGSITVKQLTEIVCAAEKMKYPMVFKEILNRLSTAKRNIIDIFDNGIKELNLELFPAVRIWDSNRNKILNWKCCWKYWKILSENDVGTELEERACVFSSLVVTELESQKLVYASRFRKQNHMEKPFPWIRPCLRKMKDVKLNDDQIVLCLTFISCLALKQNDWFIDYNNLGKLAAKLPVSQGTLRSLEIQSKCLLPGFSVCKIWRLHPTIPFKLNCDENKLEKLKQTDEKDQTESLPTHNNDITFIDPEDYTLNTQDVEYMKSLHKPARSKQIWSPEELEIIQQVKEMYDALPLSDRYTRYQALCRDNAVPDRTFTAFKIKYNRTKRLSEEV